MDFSSLIRPNILSLAPYSCARDEFKGEAEVYVDANESPFNNGINRYPDPMQPPVKAALSRLKGVPTEQIFLGNGSDEAIDLVYRVCCQPAVDNVVAISPSYGMYKVAADINDVAYREASLTSDYGLNAEAIAAQVDAHTKVLWICSPNNPTGGAFALSEIEALVQRYAQLLVVVDEAYIDFSTKGTATSLLARYDNLLILQTMSKAWGAAGIRLGIAFGHPTLISYFNRVKYPYNVNVLTQQRALTLLAAADEQQAHVALILQERARMEALLPSLPIVKHVFPSDANFLLVSVHKTGMTDQEAANYAYLSLQQRGIITRNRTRVHLCQGCLRITIGTPDECRAIGEALAAL